MSRQCLGELKPVRSVAANDEGFRWWGSLRSTHPTVLSLVAVALLGCHGLFVSPCLAAPVAPQPHTESAAPGRWQPPSREALRKEVWAWLDERKASPSVRRSAEALWPSGGKAADETDRLERLAETFALVDPRAEQIVQLCSKPHSEKTLARQDWLTDKQTPPLVAANLRLFYGRWLARELLFDEAMEQLTGIEPKEVADPATLLFYQAVVCHRLLMRDEGLQAIERLLEGGGPSPRRYTMVAQLMRADLQDLQEDTLDHIARRMDDIHRRLDLGRAGPKVRKQEDGVVKSLDKLIKKLEDQEKQRQQAAGAANLTPDKPAEVSGIGEGKGPGEVTKRNIGKKSGWGNLPPKEREEALQQIGREFPSHYREVIEQYFRRLANEPEREEAEKPAR